VNVNEIARHEKRTREIPQEHREPAGHSGIERITRLPPKQETVLELTFKDGTTKRLYGSEAETAYRVLEKS
jgi:hypothetical protein